MAEFIDITGQKFGKLTALEYAGNRKWVFKCECGNKKIIRTTDVKSGRTQSCGCYMREKILEATITHNMTHTRLYRIYASMKQRCFDSDNKSYKNYGGRGITVCDEWLGENGFINFYNWARNNGYDENAPRGQCTIDRIDVNGNYEPLNCRWADWKTQSMNKRKPMYEINGERHSLKEWSKISGVSVATIRQRIKVGWEGKDILLSTERDNRIVNSKKITYNGETHSIREWADIFGLEPNLLRERIRKGYSLDDVFNCKKGQVRKGKVVLENLNTGEKIEFESQKLLADFMGLPLYAVNRYVMGKCKQPEGYLIYRNK